MPVVPGPTQYLMGVCRLTRRSQDEKTSSYICRTRFKVDLPALRSQVSLPGNTKNRTTLLLMCYPLISSILSFLLRYVVPLMPQGCTTETRG